MSVTSANAHSWLMRCWVVSAETLLPTTQTLAEQIAAKPRLPVFAPKRHTNAVTGVRFGRDAKWLASVSKDRALKFYA